MRKTSISVGVRTTGLEDVVRGRRGFVHLGGASSDRRWAAASDRRGSGRRRRRSRDHLSPVRAAVTIGLMRTGLARVAYFGLVRNTSAADGCRGSLGASDAGEPRPPGDRAATPGSRSCDPGRLSCGGDRCLDRRPGQACRAVRTDQVVVVLGRVSRGVDEAARHERAPLSSTRESLPLVFGLRLLVDRVAPAGSVLQPSSVIRSACPLRPAGPCSR
jgi:hypothetical protein